MLKQKYLFHVFIIPLMQKKINIKILCLVVVFSFSSTVFVFFNHIHIQNLLKGCCNISAKAFMDNTCGLGNAYFFFTNILSHCCANCY